MKLFNAISGKYQTALVFMFMGLFLVAAADKKDTKPIEFDFKKTSAYSHELDTRPDYPVSITLCRNYVYSVLALGEKIDPKIKEKTINFIKNIQRQDGGFSIDIATKESNIIYTDLALMTLSYIGEVNAIDVGKVKSYVLSLQKSDGGFSFDTKTKESSFQTTYLAVHVLSYINALDIIDKAKAAAYVKGFERKETGGFNYVKGTGIPNVTNTYMGIFTLKALGMLDEQTMKNTLKFLNTTPYLTKNAKYDISQTLEEQAYAIRTLKMLGAEGKINKEHSIAFIKSFYIPVNGGFGPIHGYGSAPDPTYFGIKALSELGVLKKPAENSAK